MRELSNDVVLKKSAAYVLGEVKQVHKLNNHLTGHRKLHKIRIQLKSVRTILTIVNELNPLANLDNLEKILKSLDQKLGTWHDDIVLLKSLNYFVNRIPNRRPVQHIVNLSRRIEYQQGLRKQEISKGLNDYLTLQHLKPIENLL